MTDNFAGGKLLSIEHMRSMDAMPIKHQSESYRNRGGKKFECWEDSPSREEARGAVAGIREQGRCAFFEKQDGGAYYRVYVETSFPNT